MLDKGNVKKIPQFIHEACFTWQTRIIGSATSVLVWAEEGETVRFAVRWKDIQARAEATLSPLTPGCGPTSVQHIAPS